VVVVVGARDGKPSVVVAVNDLARNRGISANALVRAASGALGGSGGGKDDVAQGGGADVARAGEAVAAVRRELAAH
jgi:alanyl-tRNA synthetase